MIHLENPVSSSCPLHTGIPPWSPPWPPQVRADVASPLLHSNHIGFCLSGVGMNCVLPLLEGWPYLLSTAGSNSSSRMLPPLGPLFWHQGVKGCVALSQVLILALACMALDKPPYWSSGVRGTQWSSPAREAPPLRGPRCSPSLRAWLLSLELVSNSSSTWQKSVIHARGERALPQRSSYPCLHVTLISRDSSGHVCGAGPCRSLNRAPPSTELSESRTCPRRKKADGWVLFH